MRIATRLSLISIGAACVIFIIGLTSYITVANLIDDNKSFSHSREVLQELNWLLYSISDTISTQRSYIITGQDAFYDSYKASASATNESLHQIKQLVSDNPNQTLKVEKLTLLVKERLSDLEVTTDLYQQKGAEAAFQRVRIGNSLKFRAAVSRAIDDIKEAEVDLLQLREKELQRGSSSTQLTIIAGTFLGLTLLTLFSYLFGRYILNNMTQLIRALDNMNYNRFGLNIPTNSNDEFSELACAFNSVSSQLLTMSNELSKREEEIAAIMSELQEMAQERHKSKVNEVFGHFNNTLKSTTKYSAEIQKSLANLPSAVETILKSWQERLEKNGGKPDLRSADWQSEHKEN